MKLILSNWRELVALFIITSILLFGLLLLGSVDVSENSALSALVSLLVSLVSGIVKGAWVAAFAWFGLAVTLPEGNQFIVGNRFDGWWNHLTDDGKARVSLIAVAVLAIVGSLCMASS
jgi:hypothetical protein